MNNLPTANEAATKTRCFYNQKVMNDAIKETKEALKQAVRKKKKSLEFYESLSQNIRERIKMAIKNGESSISIVLQEPWNRKFPLDSFEHNDTVKGIIEELRAKGYEIWYGYDSIYCDTTVDYMNSGGECGRSTPYYKEILALNVNWK